MIGAALNFRLAGLSSAKNDGQLPFITGKPRNWLNDAKMIIILLSFE
jgi:hypothetical protein